MDVPLLRLPQSSACICLPFLYICTPLGLHSPLAPTHHPLHQSLPNGSQRMLLSNSFISFNSSLQSPKP